MLIPIGLYCFQRFQNIYSDIYSRVLSSTRPYQALTIKDKNKQTDLSDITFTFLQRISSPFPIFVFVFAFDIQGGRGIQERGDCFICYESKFGHLGLNPERPNMNFVRSGLSYIRG